MKPNPLETGLDVVLTGLSKVEMNGLQGTLEAYEPPPTGRWSVSIPSMGKRFNIKAENLIDFVSAEDAAAVELASVLESCRTLVRAHKSLSALVAGNAEGVADLLSLTECAKQALSFDAPIGWSGKSPLRMVCEMHPPQLNDAQMLLELGADPTKEAGGSFPLLVAAKTGSLLLLNLLLWEADGSGGPIPRKGVDVNQANTTDEGTTALYDACKAGHVNIVRTLVVHDSINIRKVKKINGMEPIHCAVLGDSPEILAILMAHRDIDVNSLGGSNLLRTPLHSLASRGEGVGQPGGPGLNYREMLDLLLAHEDIDVNKREQASSKTDGMTPLQYAIGHLQHHNGSQLHFVRTLLDRSDIEVDARYHALPISDEKGHFGFTALYLAQDLLNVGGGKEGAVPPTPEVAADHIAIVKELLAHGADQHNTMVGNTMGPVPQGLYNGCYDGNLEAVQLFLASGAHVNRHCMGGRGEFPLFAAAYSGHEHIVQALIEDGQINVNLATMFGATALHAATQRGFLRVAQQLIAVGGDRTQALNDGYVPGLSVQTMLMYKPIFDWFVSTKGWSPIKVAASCQLHVEAAAALKHGE